ncbi:hypothetical protein LJR219_001131 [Phenylobacterium sp. LjRoot219]|uniref:hypothetical protein n=1 Tax=Phenylobacterium sp. LjRoot219 TaxID=3342283 RepID=UPI003ECDB0C8
MSRPRAGAAAACLGLLVLGGQSAAAQTVADAAVRTAPANEAKRQRMEQQLQELISMRSEFDQRIRALEIDLHGSAAPSAVTATGAAPPGAAPAIQTIPAQASGPPPAKWGGFEPGKGIVLMRSDVGEVDMGLVSYLRYLNQHGMDKTYTSAFGQPFDVTPREDFQLAKVQITFRGWLFDPRFGYNAYVWTSQASQGLGAQVVVAGNINWTFNEALRVYFGIHSLPSTRSTNRTFPYWLRNDNRPIADEYFRGSYTQGIWAEGKIARGLEYRVMVANNLSALGVQARQLDAKINTYSGALTWMPTTGEFGPANGFGDFEHHQDVATLFSAHYTRSTEDPQSQPATDSIENTQLRLSDGTLLFSDTAFPPGRILEARYQMMALDAGIKYKGFALEGEYYVRWLDNFKIEGPVPFDHMYDTGFQLQASAMLIPKTLQFYISGSKIFGKVGNPYDVAVGFNYFPLKSRDLRVNVMGLYVDRSPVGYTAYPVPVGGDGFIFVSDFSLAF